MNGSGGRAEGRFFVLHQQAGDSFRVSAPVHRFYPSLSFQTQSLTAKRFFVMSWTALGLALLGAWPVAGLPQRRTETNTITMAPSPTGMDCRYGPFSFAPFILLPHVLHLPFHCLLQDSMEHPSRNMTQPANHLHPQLLPGPLGLRHALQRCDSDLIRHRHHRYGLLEFLVIHARRPFHSLD